MRYALVGNERVEAFPGGRARCRCCNGEVIAKCGTYRVHHWAHQGTRDCDLWAEGETEWHRAWKDYFPVECHEYIQHDAQSGEKHIADVRTQHGLVIEFQHSHLDPQERIERERFHGNVVWVVDGTRLRRDYPRFVAGKNNLRRTPVQGYFLLAFPEECFPAMWLDSSVPVIFDFRGVNLSQPPDPFRDALWCLLPGLAEGSAVIVAMSREQFVEVTSSRPQLFDIQELLTEFAQYIRTLRTTSARPLPGMPGGRELRRRSARL